MKSESKKKKKKICGGPVFSEETNITCYMFTCKSCGRHFYPKLIQLSILKKITYQLQQKCKHCADRAVVVVNNGSTNSKYKCALLQKCKN